jgi:DNA-binding NarL/FixJ family response regulator
VAQGLRNRAIGEALGVSENMVKITVKKLYDLSGMSTRVEFVLWFLRQKGLLE